MSVYDPEAFDERVAFAARHIASGRPSTRRFDTCFEMHDGDAVAVALVRRVRARPNTKLAANFEQYLGDVSYAAAERHAAVPTPRLPELAARLRREAAERFDAWLAEQRGKERANAGEDAA